MQCTSTVLMVRPASFGFNGQTAVNNHFQQKNSVNITSVQRSALKEFDMMAEQLKYNGIEVIIINDTEEPPKPDAIFPNNWFSCSKDAITLFPMYAENRRRERRADIIERVKEISGKKSLHDMAHHEENSRFLEGTGSMVCDHRYKVIYACLSERTDEQLLKEYAEMIGYSTCSFSATDKNGNNIYHTNVMMCIGDQFAILCADAINDDQRIQVIDRLYSTGRELIFISREQVESFAGNMIQLNSKAGVPYLLMSTTAAASLLPQQKTELKKYVTPLIADVSAIEKAGGGSVRCMVAEIF